MIVVTTASRIAGLHVTRPLSREAEQRKQRRDAVEEQAQWLHFVNQIVQEKPEEGDGGKSDAEPEHSGSDRKHRQPDRHD